jgi:hypothetical protein
MTEQNFFELIESDPAKVNALVTAIIKAVSAEAQAKDAQDLVNILAALVHVAALGIGTSLCHDCRSHLLNQFEQGLRLCVENWASAQRDYQCACGRVVTAEGNA